MQTFSSFIFFEDNTYFGFVALENRLNRKWYILMVKPFETSLFSYTDFILLSNFIE